MYSDAHSMVMACHAIKVGSKLIPTSPNGDRRLSEVS